MELTKDSADWISSLQGDRRWIELVKVLESTLKELTGQLTMSSIQSEKDLAKANHVIGEIKAIQMVISLPESAQKVLKKNAIRTFRRLFFLTKLRNSYENWLPPFFQFNWFWYSKGLSETTHS